MLVVRADGGTATEGGAGALEMLARQPVGHAGYFGRHIMHGLVQEHVEVTRRGALLRQPLGFAGQRLHLARAQLARGGGAEQAEGGAHPAQRHARLVNADGAAAREHDFAVLQKVVTASRHDLPQGLFGRVQL